MLTTFAAPDLTPVEEKKLPRIYKLLLKLIILGGLFFAYYVFGIVFYCAQYLWPGHYSSPAITNEGDYILLSSSGSQSGYTHINGKYLGHSISPSACMVTPQYLLLISSSRDWLLIKPLSSAIKGQWIHIGADITHISCSSQSALLDLLGGGTLAVNLHTGKISHIPGVHQVRGKYTNRSYAGITSTGECIMLPVARYSSVFKNASSFIKLAVGNHGTGVIGKMAWDYDPSTNRIAVSMVSDVRIFKSSTTTAIDPNLFYFSNKPELLPAEPVFLEPGTDHVWKIQPFIVDLSRLAVYNDDGDYLGHSVVSINPHWMQPLTLSEYKAMAEFAKELKPESTEHY